MKAVLTGFTERWNRNYRKMNSQNALVRLDQIHKYMESRAKEFL